MRILTRIVLNVKHLKQTARILRVGCLSCQTLRVLVFGDISILTDLDDNRVCVLKTMKLFVTEFKNISWDLAKLEGENKTLDEWRESHMNYFNKIDPNFNKDTKVIFEVFEVIKIPNHINS